MSKRKGLSLEEKRTRLLQLFYEKKDVYNYKEVEKAAISEKAITSQSVKDVLNSLVADGYVDTDKIGTSVYYWAFPSKALTTRQNRLAELKNKRTDTEQRLLALKSASEEQSKLREDKTERRELLVEAELLKKEKSGLVKELEHYQDSDPDVLAIEKEEIQEAVAGVNRWTDNCDNLRSWAKKTFFMSDKDFTTQSGIPEDLEYMDITFLT